jgi:hypothetical protein
MATRNEWLALAERCESADRPDQNVDVRILLACGWVLERRGNDRKAWLYPHRRADDKPRSFDKTRAFSIRSLARRGALTPSRR